MLCSIYMYCTISIRKRWSSWRRCRGAWCVLALSSSLSHALPRTYTRTHRKKTVTFLGSSVYIAYTYGLVYIHNTVYTLYTKIRIYRARWWSWRRSWCVCGGYSYVFGKLGGGWQRLLSLQLLPRHSWYVRVYDVFEYMQICAYAYVYRCRFFSICVTVRVGECLIYVHTCKYACMQTCAVSWASTALLWWCVGV